MSENTGIIPIQKSINLFDILSETKRRWYLIIVITAAMIIISLFYSLVLATPLYSSNAKIYIMNKESENINTSDISVSTYLATDFAEILSDDVVLDKVAVALDNKYSVGELKSFLRVDNPVNTRIITITVSTPDANDSKKIVDSICTVSQETLIEIMGLDKIEVIRSGKVANSPSSPNIFNNTVVSFALGLALSVLVIFILYITDNKISSSKDVEKYLELNVLATIPYNLSKNKSK